VTFSRDIRIRFQHCDPAGIVFYPRYYEMLNQMVEDWFAEGLNLTFQQLHVEQNLGVPAVHISCDFLAASRIGDTLQFDLQLVEIGTKSFKLLISAWRGDEIRLRATMTLVCVGLGESLKSREMPDSLRAAMEPFLEKANA
jgi:4-hydroxybenzoyl-CoA thioesterase